MRPSRTTAYQLLEPRLNMTSGWSLATMDVEAVWRQGYTGQDVVVAVVDSGIAIHSDLWSNVWSNKGEIAGNQRDDDGNGYIDDAFGWDFANSDSGPFDIQGHGTQVSGAIAALRNDTGGTGVAPDAEIMALRVMSDQGSASTADIANAILYAVDNGADIINLSLGTVGTRRLELAIEYAESENVLIVAASGNENASQPLFPAQYSSEKSNVISVGAHDSNFVRLPNSNRVGSSRAVQIDAPGNGVVTTTLRNRHTSTGGTSIATANVSGIAALALSANPGMPVAELRNAITAAAVQPVSGSDSMGAAHASRAITNVVPIAGPIRQLRADFDADGEVAFGDFLILSQNYGKSKATRASGDADGDGLAAFSDFLWLSETFGDSLNPANASRRSSAAATDAAFAEVLDAEPLKGDGNDSPEIGPSRWA